jgi:hypothetical protein
MIRPFTCLSLVAALGAGLYLYQEKHRAQMLDREINRTVKQAEQERDRIGLLKAEWAMLNDPERLQGLAAQHLQLQPLALSQFAKLDDLPNRLPAPVAPSAAPAPVAPSAAPAPVAPSAAPLAAVTTAPAPAEQPVAPVTSPALARPFLTAQAAPPRIPASASLADPVDPPLPAAEKPKTATPLASARPAAKPAPHAVAAAKPRERDEEHTQVMAAAEPRPFYAPVMPAYSPTPAAVHAPTVQIASAMAPAPATPFVGSALGMAHSYLAAPVPVASAAALGYASGR